MIDVPEGCTLITEPVFDVSDEFPPGTMTEGWIQAYKLQERRGEIKIKRVRYNPATDVTVMEYLSLEPDNQRRHALLRKAKAEALLQPGHIQQLKML